MRVQRTSSGKLITFSRSSALTSGGEGYIYAIPQDPSLVAKIYREPNEEHARKLALMVAHPPEDPMAAQGHVSIAWPLDLLKDVDHKGKVVGFLMTRVNDMFPIIEFYSPGTRQQFCPFFNWRYLHQTARNLAAAFHAIHQRGGVIADVNCRNILASERALVTIVDTDSFQVRDPQDGRVYRCPVGTPEYTPPELQGCDLSTVDRTSQHDCFGLAVIIFELLMEGTHPFAGAFVGMGDPPPYEERIRLGQFTYSEKNHVPYRPMPIAPSFGILNPSLQHLFVRCFEDGHRDPATRPDAQAWRNALDEAENCLSICRQNSQHYYGNHLAACPWCERTRQLDGRDPFPSAADVGGAVPAPVRPRPQPVSVHVHVSAAPRKVSPSMLRRLQQTAPPASSPYGQSSLRSSRQGPQGQLEWLAQLIAGAMVVLPFVAIILAVIFLSRDNPKKAASSHQAVYEHLRLENEHWQKGEFDAAREECKRVVEMIFSFERSERKECAAVAETQGEERAYDGKYQEAISSFDQAIRLDPSYGKAYVQRAEAYEKLRDDERAQQDYAHIEELSGLAPSDTDCLQMASMPAAILGMPTSDKKRCAAALWRQGLQFLRQGKYQEATSSFDQAVNLDPENPFAYYSRGLAYKELKQSQRAKQDYDRAVEAYYKSGLAYKALKQPQQHDHADPRRRAEFLTAHGIDQQAIASYSQAIRLNPKDAGPYYWRGLAYLRLKQPQRAIADFNQATRLNPGNGAYYQTRADLCLDRRQYKLAVQDYSQAIHLSSGSYTPDAAAYFNRALAYQKIHQYSQAIEDYGRAIRLDPGNKEAYVNDGDAHVSLKQYERAIEYYNEVIDTSPAYAEAYTHRAQAYQELGEPESAQRDFDRARELEK